MKNNFDPKELSGFRDMSDAPINDGFNQRDFEEVDPRNMGREDEEDINEEYWENFGERFD